MGVMISTKFHSDKTKEIGTKQELSVSKCLMWHNEGPKRIREYRWTYPRLIAPSLEPFRLGDKRWISENLQNPVHLKTSTGKWPDYLLTLHILFRGYLSGDSMENTPVLKIYHSSSSRVSATFYYISKHNYCKMDNFFNRKRSKTKTHIFFI